MNKRVITAPSQMLYDHYRSKSYKSSKMWSIEHGEIQGDVLKRFVTRPFVFEDAFVWTFP